MKSVSAERGRVFGFFATLSIVAFVLNWFWEMIQMPAYTRMDAQTWKQAAPICTVATLGDVGISLAIYFLGALAFRSLRWALKNSWFVYFVLALLGLISAVLIEWRALASGRWAYNARMPIVPYLHVGLWPSLQLTVLVPAATWIAVYWLNRDPST